MQTKDVWEWEQKEWRFLEGGLLEECIFMSDHSASIIDGLHGLLDYAVGGVVGITDDNGSLGGGDCESADD